MSRGMLFAILLKVMPWMLMIFVEAFIGASLEIYLKDLVATSLQVED
jgi:uncharacterized membrane-anchored protein